MFIYSTTFIYTLLELIRHIIYCLFDPKRNNLEVVLASDLPEVEMNFCNLILLNDRLNLDNLHFKTIDYSLNFTIYICPIKSIEIVFETRYFGRVVFVDISRLNNSNYL
jgi:hypothetical protein